jgi:cytoskeletal protein CcmA (bactofilin family)
MASREESYWSRFTKGGNRERDDAQDLPVGADAAPDLASALGGSPGGGMPRPPMPDVNVTLTRPTPPAPAPPPLMPTPSAPVDQVETMIGHESAVQGTIRSEHSIRIQGAVQGEIECKRSVYVEDGARVSAKVTAAEVMISGELDGQIFSSGRVEIKPNGKVTGEINAPSLVMQEGAFFDGQLRMKNRGQPDSPGAVERDVPPPSAGRRGAPGGGPAGRNSLE